MSRSRDCGWSDRWRWRLRRRWCWRTRRRRLRELKLYHLDLAIDTTTPSGRLLFHMLGAIAEFERDLIRERVVAGVRRAQEHGTRSGRPIGRARRLVDSDEIRRRRDDGRSWRRIARALKVPMSTLRRASSPCQKPNVGLWHASPRQVRVSAGADGATTR